MSCANIHWVKAHWFTIQCDAHSNNNVYSSSKRLWATISRYFMSCAHSNRGYSNWRYWSMYEYRKQNPQSQQQHTTKKVNIKWRNMKLSEWLALVSVIVFNIATEEISHTHTNIEFWMWNWNDNIMPKIDNVCCLYIFAADACEWHWTVCVYVCLCVCSASHCCLCEKNTHWFKWIEIIFHSFEICRGKEKPH